jgi:hypothetical protein
MRLVLGLALVLVLSACGAPQLTDIEEVEVSVGGSCGMLFARVDYQAETWRFDVPQDRVTHALGWGPDPVVIRVGRLGSDVWAIGPDGSSLRLIRLEEAALFFCVW